MKNHMIIAGLIAGGLLLILVSALVFRNRETRSDTPPAPVPAAAPAAEPPPRPALRYRIAVPRDIRPDFDYQHTLALPKNLARYRMKAGILIDLDRRRVLWEFNSRTPVPIASVTKLLTIYTAFEELERRQDLSLESLVTVSNECCAVAPVKIHLRPGEKVSVHELFMFAMLKSANDAAYLIAEYFGNGRHAQFIELMNETARSVGMNSSSFVNANGLPIYGKTASGTRMNLASCHDMALLIERLFDYPMILRYTSRRQSQTSRGTLTNGNRLLGAVSGMEGLKTGYTAAAGHCLAFSCRRNGRRLVGLVTGFGKRQNCFDFVAGLLDWGFRSGNR